MSRLYRNLKPFIKRLQTPNLIINEQYWNLTTLINYKFSNNPKNQKRTYFITQPFINAIPSNMEIFSESLHTFGEKSIITDSIQVKHHWYMDNTILKVLQSRDFKKNDEIFVVNRSWFYQDYNIQKSMYPTEIMHFLNVIPNYENECETFLNSIYHDGWYPKLGDYDDTNFGFQAVVTDDRQREQVILKIDSN